MTTLTKLLPPDAAPAQPLLERANQLVLSSEQRATLPEEITTPTGVVTVSVDDIRPLEVNDVFVDDAGAFWVVRPALEKVLHVKGDVDVMREAVAALINRGVRVAEAPEGFAVLPMPNIEKMLGMIGLEVTEVEAEFDPVRIVAQRGGCCCGGHGHHQEESCGCGCGGHHQEEESCGCGCGGHSHEHHHGEGECGCGGHHQEEESCGCGCGGHGHEHHHGEGECGCGGHHHQEESCGCGHKH